MPWVMWSADPYLGSVTLPSNNWLMVYGNFAHRSPPSLEFEDFLIILGLSPPPLGHFTHKLGWTKSSQRKLCSVFGHRGAEGLMVIYCVERGYGRRGATREPGRHSAFPPLCSRAGFSETAVLTKSMTLATSDLTCFGEEERVEFLILCWDRGHEHILFVER